MLDVRRFMLATAEPVHGKGGFDIPHAFEKFPGVCRPLRHRLVIFKWRASALSAHQIFGTRPASAKATARLARVSLQLWNLRLVANIRRTYRPVERQHAREHALAGIRALKRYGQTALTSTRV